MNYFNGRLDIMDGGYHDGIQYRLVGTLVENTGTYYATDAQIGDIIYLDGSFIGMPVLRYKITQVNYEESGGANLSVLVAWDMIEGLEPTEPFGGMEGIIGALHGNGLTANITPKDYNGANELLIANANSYQSMLLGMNSGGGEVPDLSQLKQDVSQLQQKVETVKLEWEDLVFLDEK